MSLPIQIAGNEKKSLVELCYYWEKNNPNEVYLRQPKGDTWKEYTWGDVMTSARKLVTSFKEQGLNKGDKIGIISKNCAHWLIAEIATMIGGYICVPFYASTNEDSFREVINLSGISLLFVGKLDEWESIKAAVPSELKVVSFPHYEGNALVNEGIKWDDFIAGKQEDNENHIPNYEDIWAIFYTSGTTGTPKGVVHPYSAPGNLLYDQEVPHNDFKIFTGGKNSFFSYLPMNHIAEQILVVTGSIYGGGTVSFAESIDTFTKNLSDTSPNIFLAVPRIWTKFQQGILAKMPEKKLNTFLKIPILSGIVKGKIKKALGLSNLKLCISGAAPMNKPLLDWYKRLGIVIQETYGMTETMGVVVMNPQSNLNFNKTGQILKNAQVKTDPETDEILVKATWLFREYYQADELNKEVFEDDGFFHTGDTGDIDKNGFLKVTGRVKDTFKTSKGKFIVPAQIESLFSDNVLIEQICILGLGMSQPIALVNLSENALKLSNDEIEDSLSKTLTSVNTQLANYQCVSKVICFKEPWSVENGILTPTLKIKRNVLHKAHCESYEGWINGDKTIIFV